MYGKENMNYSHTGTTITATNEGFNDYKKNYQPVKPEPYGGSDNPFEAIKIIRHYGLSFELGNVIKYILRNKGSRVEDLQKAINYLKYEIEKLNEK